MGSTDGTSYGAYTYDALEREPYWPSQKLRISITGAGGFIASHIARRLKSEGHYIIASDWKKNEHMTEDMFCNEFHLVDLRVMENCLKVSKGVDHVFNLAADMGGMGFIQSNHSVIMYNNTMISFNMLEAARISGVKRFFYASSACIYPEFKQLDTNVSLKESDAWPAEPQDAYGLEKLATEELCKHYTKDFGIECRIGRFHNIYGPFGTWKGGREKAPAAFCRKAITSIDKFEMWGDGLQTPGITNLSEHSWNSVNHHPKSMSNLYTKPAENLNRNRTYGNVIQHESSLFSSSFSEVFNRKLRLLGNDLSCQHASSAAPHVEEEPFKSMEEVEAQTIGNLLPDEDDLLSGVIDDLGLNTLDSKGDELEDFDLFSSGGGMELEGDDRVSMVPRNSDLVRVFNIQGGSNGLIVGEHPYGEHPSRTLFVRNINSNVEDSELKTLFEQYGDIRTLYTACKHRGFVMISYYDLRAAQNAMRALQNKSLRRRKLDIHYSIPKENQSEKDVNHGTLVVFNLDSSVSSDKLQQIFGAFGEIKEIHETLQKHNPKFIEFYDVRAAEAAFQALNSSDIAGKQIKIEPSHLWGIGCFTQQPESEQDEPNLCKSPFDELSSGNCGLTASGCMDNGSTQVVAPVSTFAETHQSSTVPINLASPARVSPIGKPLSFREPDHALDEMKFANQGVPSFHPHSLPEYHDSLANGIPFNSSSTIIDMASSSSPMMAEGLDNRHIRGARSNGHLMQPNAGVFGSSGNGSLSRNGNHYMWNNSNSPQQNLPTAMVWPNSPSFVNGIHANRLPHIPAFPRAPSVMLNVGSPVHHHIGSAPPVNSAFWDKRHPYIGESPETSGFPLGSLGSVDFPSSSLSHPVEYASHNIFSHVGGNCMDLTKTGGVHSPQQMCHFFPRRNPMMPASLDSPNDRVRNFSYRRNESNTSNADKKQYELDIDRIIRGEDSRTTLMIKNIPNKYTSKMLLAAIDEHCRGTYDFIYLPIDFKNKFNVGYAFINMIDPQYIVPFYKAFNGKKWEKFNSEKVASIAFARIQGKAALITHFQNSSLMNEDKRCRPILFHTNGPNAGDQEPFPMGTNIRPRPRRARTTSNDESHCQGSSSTLANTEEFPNGVDSLLVSSKDSD